MVSNSQQLHEIAIIEVNGRLFTEFVFKRPSPLMYPLDDGTDRRAPSNGIVVWGVPGCGAAVDRLRRKAQLLPAKAFEVTEQLVNQARELVFLPFLLSGEAPPFALMSVQFNSIQGCFGLSASREL